MSGSCACRLPQGRHFNGTFNRSARDDYLSIYLSLSVCLSVCVSVRIKVKL